MRYLGWFLLGAAPAAAFGQYIPGGTVNLTWSTGEIIASTGAPSSLSPGVIEPGEGVRFRLQISFTPPVGTPLQWLGNPATVEGWAGSIFDFVGSGSTSGTFFRMTVPPDLLITDPGPFNGTGFTLSFGQRAPFEPVPLNPSNPFVDALLFDWAPASYAPRVAQFVSRDGLTAGPPNQLILGVEYPSGHGYGFAGATGIHGAMNPIVIVPAPGAAAALAICLAYRRRRCQD